jgi:hypothetical protein
VPQTAHELAGTAVVLRVRGQFHVWLEYLAAARSTRGPCTATAHLLGCIASLRPVNLNLHHLQHTAKQQVGVGTFSLTHSLTHHTQSSRMSRAVLPPPSSCMLHRLSSRRHVTTRQGRLRPEAVQLDVSMLSLPPAPLKLSYCQATVRKTPSLS